MKFKQIRNATLNIEYGRKKFLIDPWLAEKGAIPGFSGTINDHVRNPTADLPVPISEIVNVDAVILTHVLQITGMTLPRIRYLKTYPFLYSTK